MPPLFKRTSDGLFRYRPSGVDTQVKFLEYSEVTVSTTGNIDNLDFSNATIIRMTNATDATIRGLVANFAGQIVTIVSLGAGNVFLAHQNTNSTAANRLINVATSGNTPLVAGVGTATYQYDATTARWRLIAHEQGGWITPTFAAGDYGAWNVGSWTVASATTQKYWLRGTQLFRSWSVSGTTVGSPLAVTMAAVGGFTPVSSNGIYYVGLNGAGVGEAGYYDSAFAIAGTPFACLRFGNIAFGNGNVTVHGSVFYTVT